MPKVKVHSLFTEFDINLFKAGKHYRLYEKFGSHITTLDNENGTYFAVWAPSAKSVSVIGDFNFWQESDHQLNVRWDGSGIWEGFIPSIGKGTKYKYKIQSSYNNVTTEKADPFARRCEHPPRTASEVWSDDYKWQDKKWMKNRKKNNALDAPFSVYEVHLGSWKKQIEENRFLSYRELAEELVNYVADMNFTHVEFMPIMEYPYDPSWGYQLTGYFAPTARFGYPDDFKYLVDKFHEKGIGVLLDWVPSHFPSDDHGLGYFDGSHLYEHPDRRKGYHQDWKSLIFNYGRNEIKAFLISNAIFWLDQFHADGLRVDAVASMLFLDYSREEGQWEANKYGGREYLEAIDFIKEMNTEVYASFPDVQTIAEESTSFSKVSRPIYDGGLGFGMKWMMGWMHDTLDYFKKEPIYRQHHQNELTFSLNYAFTENFMLPLSHDEVVYGKKSIVSKMPGDEWQRFGNLRVLYSFMYTHPGTKLLFQGGEFGQTSEWNFQGSLDWHLLEYDVHKGAQQLVKDLNTFYRKEPALHQKQFSYLGFEWIDLGDHKNSVLSYIRKGEDEKDNIIIVLNLTPVPRENYRIGLPKSGNLKTVFNSDQKKYFGTGNYKNTKLQSNTLEWNNRENSIELNLPPLSMLAFKYK
ncbi:1,4-alpha-glucan branching protein GlgB [Polaribacter vadi]|uniref:1,4-alpha-glucan branching protein GlgB n=1 Tax=Polaribacter TaxID=52959 RepID=UPI001C087281|nr:MULTISPECIES: 1,4-alpha-glucan branching protein GlgB [Polaribacter]MBU3010370.1 1,4-alpha-glucan branching protein GlgB [Polaribacter vadi]MDO6740177.1 1,4-alpha-glucan branching protein GlgB [Polaribacter sp. 1_MG-2023]